MDWKDFLGYAAMEVASCLFCATVVIFLHCFYDPNFTWSRKKTLFLCAYGLVELICILSFGSLANYLASPLGDVLTSLMEGVGLVLVLYDYKGKKLKAAWRYIVTGTVTIFCMYFVAMNAAILLFPEVDAWFLQNAETENALVSALSMPKQIIGMMAVVFLAFVIPVLCFLYFKMYKRGVVVQCGKREKIFAVIYPLLCLVVEGIIVWDGPKGDATRAGLTIMSIIAAMLLPIFIYYIRVSQHYQKLTISQEQYMQTELEHFMQYKQAQEETARFRHDIRNNLLCVKTMLQEGKSAEAQEYLKDLLSISDGLRKKYITGDEMLDCVIGMKTEIMDEKGINFTLDGVVAGGLQWRVMDVCAVFANAFDNAIEACEKLPQEDRFINLTIKATERFWFLTLQNPVQEKVNTKRLFMKNGGYTSKEDAKQHGIGTYNMKRVVESHGGMMKATCQDNVFALEIIIDKLQILNAS